MAPQQTFVIIKPDAVASRVTGAILGRYEAAGLSLVRLELRHINGEFADRHYAAHLGREFYPRLREFITSGPLIAVVLEGPDAVARVRALNGSTDPSQAAPGSIRADFGSTITRNAVHASESTTVAATEIDLWFGELA